MRDIGTEHDRIANRIIDLLFHDATSAEQVIDGIEIICRILKISAAAAGISPDSFKSYTDAMARDYAEVQPTIDWKLVRARERE